MSDQGYSNRDHAVDPNRDHAVDPNRDHAVDPNRDQNGDGRPALRVDVFTIFPELIESFANTSIIGRARQRALLKVNVHDPRDMTSDTHRTVDDAPFGGGAGMVMTPEPIFRAVEATEPPRPLLLLSPGGRRFDQRWAEELAEGGGFSLICGRYEGVDDRVRRELADGELSIGDVVLAGGEVAAMVVIEAVGRLVPGVLGNRNSIGDESFADGLLEYPQYTRPAVFRGSKVPDVLLSGDHGRIGRWRRGMALARTLQRRPDLIECKGGLDGEDRAVLDEFGIEYD